MRSEPNARNKRAVRECVAPGARAEEDPGQGGVHRDEAGLLPLEGQGVPLGPRHGGDLQTSGSFRNASDYVPPPPISRVWVGFIQAGPGVPWRRGQDATPAVFAHFPTKTRAGSNRTGIGAPPMEGG